MKRRRRMGGHSGVGVLLRGQQRVADVEYRFEVLREFHSSGIPGDPETPGLWDSDGKLRVADWTLDLQDEELDLELSDGRRLPIHLLYLRLRQGVFAIESGEALETFLGRAGPT